MRKTYGSDSLLDENVLIQTRIPKKMQCLLYCGVTVLYLGSSLLTFYLGKYIGDLDCKDLNGSF